MIHDFGCLISRQEEFSLLSSFVWLRLVSVGFGLRPVQSPMSNVQCPPKRERSDGLAGGRRGRNFFDARKVVENGGKRWTRLRVASARQARPSYDFRLHW